MSDGEVLPSIEADPWTRFDMWAERAYEHAQTAIVVIQKAASADPSMRDAPPLANAHAWAANDCRLIAAAAAPTMNLKPSPVGGGGDDER